MAASKSGCASVAALGVGMIENGTHALRRGQTGRTRGRKGANPGIPARNIVKP
jgi:hypothetical protein